MYRVSPSSTPAAFHLTVDASAIPDVLVDTSAARSSDPHRPANGPAQPWKRLWHQDYLRDASRWWDDWVPVATTGWGALVVIAPMLVVQFLVWVAGAASRAAGQNTTR